jgi:hypothetical protein
MAGYIFTARLLFSKFQRMIDLRITLPKKLWGMSESEDRKKESISQRCLGH